MKRITHSLLALSLPLMSLTACAKDTADDRSQSRVVAGSAAVSGLNTKIVGADALWLMHLDLNALRESTVGKELVIQITTLQGKAMESQNFPIQVDVPKLLATIGSITAYGANLEQDPKLVDGALIFQGTPDLRTIAEGLVAQATVTTPDKISELKDLPIEAYAVGGQLIVAFPKEPIILVSKSKTQLLAAYKVFQGEAPSLAKAKTSPLNGLIRNQTGAFVLAASVVPSEKFFSEDAPQARILQMAKSASVELGEENKQTFAHVQLLASSDESADKLMKILQGITAMISLAESSDQYLSEFLKSVAVTREKNVVTLHLAYSSERLVQMARDLQQKQERDREQRRMARQSAPELVVTNEPVAPVEDKVVLQWKADQRLGNIGVSPGTLVSRTVGNVPLTTGSVIVLTGHRNEGENARFDYVEIAPADGSGTSQRIEAEDMKLDKYMVLSNRHGSGGKLIQILNSHGTARFPFAGTAGMYTITVRYVDENDGVSSFFVSVKDSQPEKP